MKAVCLISRFVVVCGTALPIYKLAGCIFYSFSLLFNCLATKNLKQVVTNVYGDEEQNAMAILVTVGVVQNCERLKC